MLNEPCRDGKSNYMEGLLLVTLYLVIALACESFPFHSRPPSTYRYSFSLGQLIEYSQLDAYPRNQGHPIRTYNRVARFPMIFIIFEPLLYMLTGAFCYHYPGWCFCVYIYIVFGLCLSRDVSRGSSSLLVRRFYGNRLLCINELSFILCLGDKLVIVHMFKRHIDTV